MTASTQTSNHFNLHVSGIGYLNRVRWVEPKGAGRKAQPFLACSISALRGNSDQPDTTYFDLRVSGGDAIQMVEQLKVDVDANRKVVLSFRVGDIYPHVYMRNVRDRNGRNTGEQEPAALIKGRLLVINSITIDGENVFRRESGNEDQPSTAQAEEDGNHHQDKPQERAPEHHEREQRPVQPSRPAQAPREHADRNSRAYQAGYAAGRTTRFVRNSVAA